MSTQLPAKLPVLLHDEGLAAYLRQIRAFPVLTSEEEYELAQRWRDDGDLEAAHRLVTSHLRLVAKIAMGYRGYGLPIAELISEGNIGMMQAVKRFEPERGFRLATYAMWWIKASIKEYVLRSWSMVKIGTTTAQKKLFFNLQRLKKKLRSDEDHYNVEEIELSLDVVAEIASRLDVSPSDVISMNQRLSGSDHSLNVSRYSDGKGEYQDLLVDQAPDQETLFSDNQESSLRHGWLMDSLQVLSPRERDIIMSRQLAENPETLEILGEKYSISRERVRQIEARALEKLGDYVRLAEKKPIKPLIKPPIQMSK